jgi:hypothetical protein
MKKEIELKNIGEVEGLETSEGVMKPLIFGEKVAVIHLEIPAGLELSPHAHSTEGEKNEKQNAGIGRNGSGAVLDAFSSFTCNSVCRGTRRLRLRRLRQCK